MSRQQHSITIGPKVGMRAGIKRKAINMKSRTQVLLYPRLHDWWKTPSLPQTQQKSVWHWVHFIWLHPWFFSIKVLHLGHFQVSFLFKYCWNLPIALLQDLLPCHSLLQLPQNSWPFSHISLVFTLMGWVIRTCLSQLGIGQNLFKGSQSSSNSFYRLWTS